MNKVEEPEPEGWIKQMIADINAYFKKCPDGIIYKVKEI